MAHPDGPGAAWRRVLVLGGIRSGKSELAETLVSGSPAVTYVAAARRNAGDPEWRARIDAHRDRRPAHWSTLEVGHAPLDLPGVLRAAQSGDTVLVDDLGTWTAAVIEVTGPAQRRDAVTGAAAAVAACPARLVLVSPEVGLCLVPSTPAGRTFADALGTVNQAIAAACDTVVLVIAGNAVPVKGRL